MTDHTDNLPLQDILTTAQRCGLAHNNGAGGQYLLCATEAQLRAFAAALSAPAPDTQALSEFTANWGPAPNHGAYPAWMRDLRACLTPDTQAAEPVALPHKHDGDTAAAVGNLMFALETWKATTPRTAPPAFATLVQACADLVSAARTSQAAEPVRAIDPDAVYEGMREIDPAWNAHGRDREYAVAVALTVVNRMLSAAPQLAAAKPEGDE